MTPQRMSFFHIIIPMKFELLYNFSIHCRSVCNHFDDQLQPIWYRIRFIENQKYSTLPTNAKLGRDFDRASDAIVEKFNDANSEIRQTSNLDSFRNERKNMSK